MLYIPYPFRRCTKCAAEYPPTTEYFGKRKTRRDGLDAWCRRCYVENAKRYANTHQDKIKDYKRQYAVENVEKIKATRKRIYWRNPEKARAYSRAYERRNRARVYANITRWQKEHPEKRRAYGRAYRLKYPQKAKQNYLRNKTKMLQRNKLWRKNNRDKVRIFGVRYRTRKRELPNDWNIDNWQRCLEYFNHCCAVCGRPAGLWHVIAMDHWIPLTVPTCPGTTPTNIVPLCHDRKDGNGGCNNSKGNKNAEEWLIDKFGPRKAKQILARIEQYFKWVAEQDKEQH